VLCAVKVLIRIDAANAASNTRSEVAPTVNGTPRTRGTPMRMRLEKWVGIPSFFWASNKGYPQLHCVIREPLA
jgi:hypothetical protein